MLGNRARVDRWCLGRGVIGAKRQHVDYTRLLEGAMDVRRSRDQREVIATPLAESAAEDDHRHADRVDLREATEIERDARDSLFADAVDFGLEQVCRTMVQLAGQDE